MYHSYFFGRYAARQPRFESAGARASVSTIIFIAPAAARASV
ncbi:MAG: hypothetical protein WBB73_04630 [Candidatus Aminicenantaceae bacterium]